MPKYDIKAKQVNIFEKESSAQFYDSSLEKNLNQIIESIIKSNDKYELQKNFKDADALVEGKNPSDCKKIIADLVKKNIDSIEKKNSFSQKVEQFMFGASTSLFANFLFEAIKNFI